MGVKDAYISIDSGKIINIKNKHPEMTDDIIKKIPELLEHPYVIMESRSVPGRIVVYGDVVSSIGPVMTALELNPTNRGYDIDDMIKVASAYTRNNTQSLINSSNLLWVYDNKKKTNDWLRRTRLQLPVQPNQYGLIKKISQTPINVNSQSSGSTHSFRNLNSPRKILADALDSAAQTDEEKKHSQILWVYDNKKKTTDWLRRTRLQLPVQPNQYGLIKKISQNEADVNAFSLRDNTSPRTILADALDTAAANDEERRILKEYKEGTRQIEMMEMLAKEMDKAAEEAKTVAERSEYLKKAKIHRTDITAADKKLLELEATKPLMNVLNREVKARQDEGMEALKKRYTVREERKRMAMRRNRTKNEITVRRGIEPLFSP